MGSSRVVENMTFLNHKYEPGVLCGSAWPTQLSTGHRVSSKTVEDRMSHAGRKSSTWQSSLPSLTFPPGSSERLWRRSTQPVYLDHIAAALLVTVCLSLSAPTPSPSSAPSLPSGHTILSRMKWCRDVTLADSNIHGQAQGKWSLTERCILDQNKALQDVRKPVSGYRENAKQSFTSNPEKAGYWIISCREELSRDACSQNRSSSKRQNSVSAGMEKKKYLH